MKRIASILLFVLACISVQATLYETNYITATAFAGVTTGTYHAQTFTIGTTGTNETFLIDSIDLGWIESGYYTNSGIGLQSYDVVTIRTTSAGLPTSTIVCSKSGVSGNYVIMGSAVLQSGTTYALVVSTSDAGSRSWGLRIDNSYSSGSRYTSTNGTSWTISTNQDQSFRIYGHRNPTVTSQPSSITRCVGTSASFSVTVNADSPTYQWRKDGSNITGATSSTYTIASVVSGNAGSYDCVVTESLLGTSITSSQAVLTVPATTDITVEPSSISRCSGTSASFSVTAVGGSLTYQWYKSGVLISGATSSTYTIPSVVSGDAGNYSVNVNGTCGSDASALASLTIIPSAVITGNPTSATRCEGTSVTFTVTATGSGLTYQWQKNGSNISATSSSYTISNVTTDNAGDYRCIVTGSCNTVTSTVATLTISISPSITSQPTNSILCEGSNKTFSVTSLGSGLTYQWYKDGVSIPSATNSTYSITGVTLSDQALYTVNVTNSCGSQLSTTALLKVADNDYETLLTGLVSYWGFNDLPSNSVIEDEAGTNEGVSHSVTKTGSDTYRVTYGDFNAITDYVSLTTSDTRTTGTYNFWIYPTSVTDDRLILSSDPYYSRIFINSSRIVKLETNTNGQEFGFYSNPVTLNTWTMVSLVRSGDNISLYLNGTFAETANISGAAALSINQIGNNGRGFIGDIDEVSIYSRALTASEVSLIYNSGKGMIYSMLNVCDYNPVTPPDSSTLRKKIILSSKARNIILANIARDFGSYSSGSVPPVYIDYGLVAYDSTYEIASRQKYAIPEEVSNGDYVGYFRKNITYSGTATFSVYSSSRTGAYSINSTTGLITISGANLINGQITPQDVIDYLLIRSDDIARGTWEVDTAVIRIKESSYCRFIDLSKAPGGGGTILNAYGDMDDFTITAGYGYFIKRSTTETGEFTLFNRIISTIDHPTIIGAYGTGRNPTFDGAFGSSPQSAFFIGPSDGWGIDDKSEYLEFYDITVRRYNFASFYVKTPSDHLGFYNLNIYNNYRNGTGGAAFVCYNDWPGYDWNMGDTAKVLDIHLINCNFDTIPTVTCTSSCEVAYFKGAFGTMQNSDFEPLGISTDQNVVRFSQGSGITLSHCIFRMGITTSNGSMRCIQLRADDATFIDCKIIDGGIGIYVTDPGTSSYGYENFPDGLHLVNCLFRNNAYGVYYGPTSTSMNHSVGNIIENSMFDANSINALMIRDWYNGSIRRNIIKDGSSIGILGSASESNVNVSIFYNLIYDFTSDEIQIPLSTGLHVYNNTVVGSINLTGSTSPSVINNFYNSSTTNTSNNIDIDGISTSAYFVDYANRDFRLLETATGAINQGANLGLSPDIYNTTIPQGSATDIGAVEYIVVSRSFPYTFPIIF